MNDIVEKVQQLGRKGTNIQNTALKAAAQPIAEDMRSIVRVSDVKEKHIKDDIQVSNIKTRNGKKYIRIGPGEKTNWRAKFLEIGTSKMSAKPFMSPAYENNKGEARQIIRQKLKEGLGL